jgi:hypothetical protein
MNFKSNVCSLENRCEDLKGPAVSIFRVQP